MSNESTKHLWIVIINHGLYTWTLLFFNFQKNFWNVIPVKLGLQTLSDSYPLNLCTPVYTCQIIMAAARYNSPSSLHSIPWQERLSSVDLQFNRKGRFLSLQSLQTLCLSPHTIDCPYTHLHKLFCKRT